MSDSPDISVCICTFRREHVAETIRSVLAQRGLGARTIEIVVADDDPARSAEALVAAAAKTAAVPLRYVHSGARNVATARNACLDAARGRWLAFIDDDEIAKPDWLRALLDVQDATGAGIIKGRVQGIYPIATPNWIRRADPYTRDYGADGEKPPGLASGNVLFRRELAQAKRIRFDPAFGRTGGEDNDFFGRLCDVGAKPVAARSAIVDEIVSDARVTPAYFKSRYRRAGQTDGRKLRLGRGDDAVLYAVPVALAAALLLWIYPVFRIFGGKAAFKAFSKFWYSVGVLEGLSGRVSEEM